VNRLATINQPRRSCCVIIGSPSEEESVREVGRTCTLSSIDAPSSRTRNPVTPSITGSASC